MKSKKPQAAQVGNAVKMDPPTAPGYFPAGDPRAGYYEPGRLYRVPTDIPQEKAAALVQGGGFVWAEALEGDS